MGIGDAIGEAVAANKKKKEANKQARLAGEDRERAVDMAASANYQPFLVSDAIGPYQRSQSPVARGYIESLLTGANPAAVQGVRAGAPQAQRTASQQFRDAYGGWEQLRAQQRAMETSTPWQTRPQGPAVTDEMKWNAKLGQGGRALMQRLGLSYDDLAALENAQISVNARKGELDGLNRNADREAGALNKLAERGDTDSIKRFLDGSREGTNTQSSAREYWALSKGRGR